MPALPAGFSVFCAIFANLKINHNKFKRLRNFIQALDVSRSTLSRLERFDPDLVDLNLIIQNLK